MVTNELGDHFSLTKKKKIIFQIIFGIVIPVSITALLILCLAPKILNRLRKKDLTERFRGTVYHNVPGRYLLNICECWIKFA